MSCLFDSLSKSVGISSRQLRLKIVEYLKTNPLILDDCKASDVINWTEGSDINNYTHSMSKNCTWGGAIEIKCFCDLYSAKVVVHVSYTGKQFVIESTKTPSIEVHIRYNGAHFNYLQSSLI